jgi:ribosomal protein L37AE/L43A
MERRIRRRAMPMNRVQFQPGLSMAEFVRRYGTEQQCERALIDHRWPSGFICPRCGGVGARTSFVRQSRRYWQCGSCQHQCSVTSGTLFEASKLPLTLWFLAMQLLTQSKNNVSALELKRHLGVCYRTAWLVKHKILEAMRLAESDRQLTGRVEIDDAYLGGERSGGKTGRGSENKVPFVAAVQTTETGLPHLACLSPRPFTNESVEAFLASHTVLPLTVVSDGLACFKVATSLRAVHEREITGGGKASVLNEKFRAVNTLIGNVKTALTGTYHAIDFAKYAYRYLAEVQFRFNRRYDLRAILGSLLRALACSPSQPERRIRLAELHR